jgi:hypothetical protein
VIDTVAESHVFTNPVVRRVGKILLVILMPIVVLRDLFRLASRQMPKAQAKPRPKTEEPELVEHK